MSTEKYYVGIDLGGMSAKGGLFSPEGKMVAKSTVKTCKEEGFAVTAKNLAGLAREVCELAKVPLSQLGGVGVGTPGIIDGANGIVVAWTNFDWENVPLAAEMSKNLGGIPVKISNDANAAALGEAKFGAGKKFTDSITISRGTVVGSGSSIGGKSFEGFRGGAGEAGHMTLVVGGIPCTCGRRGCFEQYASASALIRDTKKAMFEHKDSAMWKIAPDPEEVNGVTSFTAAKEGDKAAQEVVKNYIMYLSEGILNLVNCFRPQAIIIGGGVSGQGEYLLQPVRKYVDEHLFVGFDRIPLSIVRAQLGNDAGIWGAYALAAND